MQKIFMQLLIALFTLCTAFAAMAQFKFKVSPLPSVEVGPQPGQTITIPIILTILGQDSLNEYSFHFKYPAARLNYQNLEVVGTLSQTFTFLGGQENETGDITIGWGNTTYITSSDTLIKVKFTTTGTGGTGSLQLRNFLDDLKDVTDTVDGVLNSSVPVELVSFSADIVENTVHLNWATASETNNFGFDVEKSGDGILFSRVGFVAGRGTTTVPQSYSFVENNVSAGKHFYRLKQIDTDGAFEHSNVIEALVLPPARFSLSQNYPNPFNPETRIRFDIPNLQGEKVRVQLSVYNLFGQLVRTLVNEDRAPGEHEIDWNGRNDAGIVAPSGMYFYTVRAGNFKETRKMLFLR